VRDWTRFLRHRIKKYPDSTVHTLSDLLPIYFFPLWRADLFFHRCAVEFAGYVWTVAVSGKKKLRIRRYPDTCGRDLTVRKTLFTFVPELSKDIIYVPEDKKLREKCIDACLFSIIVYRLGWLSDPCDCVRVLLKLYSFFKRIQAVSRNKSIRQWFWLLFVVQSDHLLLTYFLMTYLFWLHFRRCAVSHVNQSRAVSTFENWLSHGKAWHVLWWSVSVEISCPSFERGLILKTSSHLVLTNWNARGSYEYN